MDDAITSAPRRKRRILGLDDRQRQNERRRLVLDAALELFGTRGYANTSIELLCQTAGVGTNSFYDLFSSKEAVMVALYDQLTEGLHQAVADRYSTHRDDPEPIRPLVSAFVHAAVDDPRVARVAFIEAAGISATVEEHRRRARDLFVGGLQVIGAEVRRTYAQAPAPARGNRGEVRRGLRSRRNAVAVVGAIVELTLDWLLDPVDPIEDLIDDIAHHTRRVVVAIAHEPDTPG